MLDVFRLEVFKLTMARGKPLFLGQKDLFLASITVIFDFKFNF